MNQQKKYSIVSVLCFLILTGAIFLMAFSSETTDNSAVIKKCLIISDIHFDPMYGSKDTVLKRKLTAASFAEWKKYLENSSAQMTMDTSLLGNDANYAVLRSAIVNMKKTLPHPAFIIIAGDFIWHNATIADSTLKKKSIQFIAWLFKENFPGVPIVPGLGNNDTYGKNYTMQDSRFLKDFAEAWEPNLPKSSADSLKANGYYTCETDNLKLTVINSTLVGFKNNYPQASHMLNWLHRNLANGKNTWIISHIPPGVNGYDTSQFWKPEFTGEFVNDIVKHSSVIKFMIASHTHFDDFKVVYDAAGTPVSFMRIVPSICSNHGNNPSFEVAEFNNRTGRVVKETNHYLNLAVIQKGKGKINVVWKDKLTLPSSFKMSEINAVSFSKLINDIKNDKTRETFKSYVNFYTVGTPIDSSGTINRGNYLNYLKADSLKEIYNHVAGNR